MRTLLCLPAVLLLCFQTFSLARELNADDVDRAIRRGVDAELRRLAAYRDGGHIGYVAISLIALLNAGVPKDNPVVADAIRFIADEADGRINDQYVGTYEAGLVNMLLGQLKNPAYRRLAERMASNLRLFQAADGGWGDFSRTQFALLGLKAAEDVGASVPQEVYVRARNYIIAGQHKDGGWGYNPHDSGSYGSMTAAGITSLFIVNERTYEGSATCGVQSADPRLKGALSWLADHFTVRSNPQKGGHHYYYLYALERIGVLVGQKYIGGHDWYREGADYLIQAQQPDGTWNENDILSTEFALLFLGKGREPIVIQKLNYGPDWNSDPYDAKKLAEMASRELGLPMTTQSIDKDAGAAMLAEAPILYLQGRGPFHFSDELRSAIKSYIDQGGFIVASACCGGAPFDLSFRTEMRQIFPDGEFERLPENHDIFTARHAVSNPRAFTIEGLNTGCRTAVIYSPHDICCAWGGCKGTKDKFNIVGQDAKNIGINLVAYVLGYQKLRQKLDSVAVNGQPAEVKKAPPGSLYIGQIYHTGDWDPDPNSIANLARTLKEKSGMKGDVAKRQVVVGNDDLSEYPLLYITGHKNFQLAPSQVDALRKYLDRGGFLLADACCGKPEFDAGFRRLTEELFPGRTLEQLPLNHTILQEPYLIEKVAYKPGVKQFFPAVGDKPFLEGIAAADGRLQVVYSRFNFGCELQGHGCANCLGILKQDAYKIAVNAVLYAISH